MGERGLGIRSGATKQSTSIFTTKLIN